MCTAFHAMHASNAPKISGHKIVEPATLSNQQHYSTFGLMIGRCYCQCIPGANPLNWQLPSLSLYCCICGSDDATHEQANFDCLRQQVQLAQTMYQDGDDVLFNFVQVFL